MTLNYSTFEVCSAESTHLPPRYKQKDEASPRYVKEGHHNSSDKRNFTDGDKELGEHEHNRS